jgi:UPF0271 protein
MLPWVSSINVACGLHAGSPTRIRQLARAAIKTGVNIGAHPGYPDAAGFGRRPMDLTSDEVRDVVLFQVAAAGGIVRAENGRLSHVKPHGALYNRACVDRPTAVAIAAAVAEWDRDCVLVGPANSALIHAGIDAGLRTWNEVFADRSYLGDGTLVPRDRQGAVLDDPETIASRAIRIIGDGFILAIDGSKIPIEADTICVHGDTPNALEIAKCLRNRLVASGICVVAAK